MPTKASNEMWTEHLQLDPRHVTRQGAVGKHIPCHYCWEYLHGVALWSLRHSVITCPRLPDPQYHVRSTFSMHVKNFTGFFGSISVKKLQHGMKYYFTLWINFRFSTLLFQQVLTPKMIKLFCWWILGRRGPDLPYYRPFFFNFIFLF